MRAFVSVASCVLVVVEALCAQHAPGGPPPSTDVLLGGNEQGGSDSGLLGSISTSNAAWNTIGHPTTIGSLPGLALDGAGKLYGLNDTGGTADTLIRINKATGELVATLGDLKDSDDGGDLQMSDIAFRPATGQLYGMCTSSGKVGFIYTIDILTGAATLVGHSSIEPGGMAFTSDDRLFVATLGATDAPQLSELSPTNGGQVATPVGLKTGCSALAIRSDGVFFGMEFDSNTLVTIDPGDGTETTVGDADPPSGNVSSLTFVPGPGATVASYFLPRVVSVKLNTKAPTKSHLTCTGFFDLGPDPVDLSLGATVDVGGYEVVAPALVPNKKGTVFKLKQAGLLLTIKPDKSGSSRALFTLKVKDDLAGLVDPDGVLHLHFTSSAVDAQGAVTLEQGKYKLGKKRGELIEPAIYLFKVRGTLKGGGLDVLALKAGMATDGTTPVTPPDMELDFGATFNAAVPFLDWVQKGDKFSVKNVNGLSLVVLDYLRETVTAKAKAVDLGAFTDGPQEVDVTIGLGADVRIVRVRMVRKGKLLKY